MNILFAASEAMPFVMSGGLGDVAGSLPKAIRNRHVACRVVLPLYKSIGKDRSDLKYLTNFTVDVGWRKQYCGVFKANVGGVVYYLLDNEYYFYRDNLYGYDDDAERFAFFSRAIVEMIGHISFRPDLIHCNDWQTALIPLYLDSFYRKNPKYESVRTLFTIHNIQYQGKYGLELIDDVVGIPKKMRSVIEYDGNTNYMKSAIERADRVSTVSPTYAEEILNPWYAHGLDRFLKERSFKLSGILNGIDTVSYDPETDKSIFTAYNASSFDEKKSNTSGLRSYLGLEQRADKPVIGMVTRLVSHKGVDLVQAVFKRIVEEGMQVVILGSGERQYEEFFESMQRFYPENVSVIIGFRPELARKIYAGSDLFLMPSQSEPCGLAQMVALRYGSIPIVRETGGLKDSIVDVGEEGGYGFTFKTYNADDLFHAVMRAKEAFSDRAAWSLLVKKAMECDFSWGRSAARYIELYRQIKG